jgi:hypothetical protein
MDEKTFHGYISRRVREFKEIMYELHLRYGYPLENITIELIYKNKK